MSRPDTRLLLIFVLVLFSHSAAAEPPASWEWQNPLPQGNNLEAVWGLSSDEVYAIGGDQTLMRWDGVGWSTASRPASYPLFDLWGLDSGVIFAAGYYGTVLRFDGQDWTQIPTDFTATLEAILAFSETDIYVAERFPSRGIRHYDGAEWTLIGTATDGIHDLGGSSPSDIYAVGFEGMMNHYNGVEWTNVEGFINIDLTSVWSNSADDVFALQQGSILHHFDGLEWTQVGSDNTVSWESDMWGSSYSNLWFVDGNGGLSHFNGADVTTFDLPNDGLVGIWGDGFGEIHAVGDHGSLLSYDGGQWTAHSTAAAYEKLHMVWGLDANDIYAVGSLEIVLHYDGDQWSKIHPTQFSVWYNDVWAAATDEVYVVGKAGIKHYDGVDWTPMDDGLRHLLLPLTGIHGFGSDDIVAVAEWGAIVRFDGMEWTIVREPDFAQADLRAVWGAAPDDIWAVGPDDEFLHWDGLTWNSVPVSTPGGVTAIIGWASDDIYALGSGGDLQHWDGDTWTTSDDLVGQGIKFIHGQSSSNLYAISSYGYAWHFDGQDWNWVDTKARTGMEAVWTSADGAVFLVGQGSSILSGASTATPVPELSMGTPFQLHSQPNPFNPSTSIHFEMPEAGWATLAIHDASGRRIATLIDRPVEAGGNSVSWDGRDARGRRQASGVYFVSVRTETGREVQKLTLVK